MALIRRNERDWAGQLTSWLKEAINQGLSSFEDVTNDTGIKSSTGRTKFPDILLFSNKTSGIIFNGWELKFPDTAVDNPDMLENALEKAKRIKSDSFVTWNGAEAVIWKIDTGKYTVETLEKIRHYPRVPSIQNREDLSDPARYASHEEELHNRALDILHDLDMLYRDGIIKEALNISGNIIHAIKNSQNIIVPQFAEAIAAEYNSSPEFRRQFNRWKIYEGATLNILSSSSRKSETIDPKVVLAKFTFYNLIGKTLFYLTLSENLPSKLPPLAIGSPEDLQDRLYSYFNIAKSIDYQAVFMPYFTDSIPFSQTVNSTLARLVSILSEFDFRILPASVIGTILENLVPRDEKLKFGQYFTPEILANIVAFPAVQNNNSVLFDPTSGTGTFLAAFYNILLYYGNKKHSRILEQVWGNDISHFPAILSVINLYRQDVGTTNNFPRVIRDDFFNLSVGKTVNFPDSQNHDNKIPVAIPSFDGIASNFPFIQQEDISNDKLSVFFKRQFGLNQASFVKDGCFQINERSDYYTYCIYNSFRFLKPGGIISAITSNAWLGKEYGVQFKSFLLNNFHIRYIVRSTAEHWFSNAQVSTVFFVLEKKESDEPTKFVSLNFKLSEKFGNTGTHEQIAMIDSLYAQIDFCQPEFNSEWSVDSAFHNLYHKIDGSVDVSVISKDTLIKSLASGVNWSQFFTTENPIEVFEPYLSQYSSSIFKVIRGERTGWNNMFIIPEKNINASGISPEYLISYVKTPAEFTTINFSGQTRNMVFVCHESASCLDSGTKKWIERFENVPNKNGSATVAEANAGHKPFWYSISPKKAHIATAINPYDRFFFSYSTTPFAIDQRMIAMQIQDGYDIDLIAALLNSVSTFIAIEFIGTSRNLGVLDLNANFLKKIRFLNPDIISDEAKTKIRHAFEPLKNREIGTIFEECQMQDRISFDTAVLEAYGISTDILKPLYNLLCNSVSNRISLKDK